MQVGGPPVAGIGVEIASADHGARLIGTVKGAPAERAGFRQGDILTRIDDRALEGMPLSDIALLLRGETGSTVLVTLRDPQTAVSRTVTLVREPVIRESVTTRLLESGVVFIRVTQFDRDAPQKIGDSLADAQLASGGALTGIILDLRASEGGLLNVAIAIATAFLPKNALIVSLTGRKEVAPPRLYASPKFYVPSRQKDPYTSLAAQAKSAPMVVIVSKTTAAGAEAVAAALQDHKRAMIVGTNTFGKGFVETMLPLTGGGALLLTTTSMIRPVGTPLQDVGVTPDVRITEVPDDLPRMGSGPNSDPALKEAVKILKAR